MILFAFVENTIPTHQKFQISDELIFQIGQDDTQAFREFYEQTQKTLFSYILSFVLNPHDAEDILQDTYMKIRSAAHLYEPQGKPMAWVFTVAKNLSFMHLRGKKRISDIEIDDLENNTILPNIMDQEDKILLEYLLKELEETERTVILLHAVSGYKHREISKNLEIPLATVLSKYHRGLLKLRKKMKLQKVNRL